MINSSVNAVPCTNRDQTDWSLHTLEDEAELEELDRRAGHDYLPMDVYVDPVEQRAHFAAAAVVGRLTRMHRISVRHRN
jgi:hypothetical protein